MVHKYDADVAEQDRMTYTARLKVFCDNKDILSKLSYTFANTTTKQNYGGKIDSNGCTKVYNCNKLDLIFVELFLNNSKLESTCPCIRKW